MGEFVFRGIDGAELEAFMLHLRRLALSEGKHRDEDWMLDVVTANLAEGAMRWFETLEDEQQKNWKAFRKALFKEYPAPAGRDAPKPVAKTIMHSLIPPAASSYVSAVCVPRPPTPQVRLKLVFDSGSFVYVSRQQKEGLHIATRVLSDRDVVQYRATSTNSVRTCRLSWEKDIALSLSKLSGDGPIRTALCTDTLVFPNRWISSDKNPKAIALPGVWRVLDGGEVEVWLVSVVADAPLQVMVKEEDICLMSPSAVEQLSAKEEGWEKVRIVVEEV